ncbi:hypothetical protein [Companilactobacillus nodensis]|uniref:Uncharacterized protein n=1 Tax=Companilactobacillus nodensis DSM 19682 = JCM 14932 = NBRC 107160 TaxID=1423775 RepID=A0A0R1KHR3_9LACO|nr:hypothetical protein [Companilactobacillus nodensis]KRK79530.1 hypothetical protein FD03_GL000665 [Companilactobacillus nodensis DSM 19682 = JCM 14932 = NBRC 107160]
MNNSTYKKYKKLFASLIEFLSYHIFPFIFIFGHNLNNYTINWYLAIMIGMVAIYKEYIRSLKPNMYFNGLYSIIYVILIVLSSKSLNLNVIILIFVQLVLLFITKYFDEKYQLVQTLIESFIIPSFMSIAIAYTYMHFISFTFVVPLLLVNIAAILIDYFEGARSDYIQLVTLSGLTLILFLLGYINALTAITIVIFVVVAVLLKKFRHLSTSNLFYRVIGNFLLLI